MVQMLAPVEAEPVYVPLDGVDVFLLLLRGVGVIEAKVAAAAVFCRQAEIQADRLGVAEMQIAVRLRWKARDDALHQAAGKISLDHVANEVPGLVVCSGLRHRLPVIHLPVNLHTGAYTWARTHGRLPGKSAARPIVTLPAWPAMSIPANRPYRADVMRLLSVPPRY